MNIISNAIKFTEDSGKIAISVGMEHLSPTQVKIILKVRDYGIGINAEDLYNLFLPYFKTTDNKSKSLNSKSHGLGLSICKRIVETMSG